MAEGGLTHGEASVMDALADAADCFAALPVQHDSDADEFFAAIHRAQDLLAVRVCRRMYPEYWSTKEDADA